MPPILSSSWLQLLTLNLGFFHSEFFSKALQPIDTATLAELHEKGAERWCKDKVDHKMKYQGYLFLDHAYKNN
jgi:hypothetical protein